MLCFFFSPFSLSFSTKSQLNELRVRVKSSLLNCTLRLMDRLRGFRENLFFLRIIRYFFLLTPFPAPLLKEDAVQLEEEGRKMHRRHGQSPLPLLRRLRDGGLIEMGFNLIFRRFSACEIKVARANENVRWNARVICKSVDYSPVYSYSSRFYSFFLISLFSFRFSSSFFYSSLCFLSLAIYVNIYRMSHSLRLLFHILRKQANVIEK